LLSYAAMCALSTRQQSILNRVIETHIETMLPVGSKAITAIFQELYRGSYSSATIRNEMMILEGQGYLTHPHTSAGRIPTDRGYRYYVDQTLEDTRSKPNNDLIPEESLGGLMPASVFFADRISQILSQLTKQISVMLAPAPDANAQASGSEYQLFFSGASYVLDQPEFRNARKIKALIEFLEEKRQFTDWMVECQSENKVCITIGAENKPRALHDLAMISMPVLMGDRVGIIAVLGPKRMRYPNSIQRLGYMKSVIEEIWDKKKREFLKYE